jgi:hypothetical protein
VLKTRLNSGESHSPVVHELWVLVVGGSNPPSPTNHHDPSRKTRAIPALHDVRWADAKSCPHLGQMNQYDRHNARALRTNSGPNANHIMRPEKPTRTGTMIESKDPQ